MKDQTADRIHRVVGTLARLVEINSVNTAFDGPGELSLAEWIEDYFKECGIETRRQEVYPDRPNLIARLPGRDPSRKVVFEAHMDTVSIQGMTIPPFQPVIEGNLLYGRGSCDTKAGIAAMMEAIRSLHEEGFVPACDLWLAAAVDEEFSFGGAARFCGDGLQAEAAIVAEPTEMKLVVASKGVLRWRIVVHGRAAHSSKPELGKNAISHMARIILAIERHDEQLVSAPHPLLGPATSNVGIIRGGVQVNFVPDRCAIEIDRRLLPGEKVPEVLAGYQAVLDELGRQHPGLRAEMEPPMLVDQALSTAADSKVVRTAAAVLTGLGRDPKPCGVPYGSDASKFSHAGIPSIIFGPGSIDRAHTACEYVEIDQVIEAFEFYRRFITNLD
jgi:acetylornithine deacetylase/succinyl-diaminopimelate desuccinylase family protein